MTKVRREGLPVLWDVSMNLLVIANQINGFIFEWLLMIDLVVPS
jgi:hypothetical protein